MSERNELRTWIEIDTTAVAHNYKQFRAFTKKHMMILGVVKSNAYGHNLSEFALLLEKLAVDWLGVDSLVEGIRLRKDGVKIPILVLGYTLPTRFAEAIRYKLTITLSSLDQIRAVLTTLTKNQKLSAHIELDTGMHRQGLQRDEREKFLKLISSKEFLSHINITGVYTHFADAKRELGNEFTERQIHEFADWKNALEKNDVKGILYHASATAGVLRYREAWFDMVRVGIGMYGIYPARNIEEALKARIKLRPALSWKSIISEIKKVAKYETVGYDRSERLVRDSVLAIVPIGYWHGYRRALSGKSRVLVGGKSARVLGMVSMDMLIIDITDIKNVKVGDEVVLIGKQRGEEISARELAEFSGTTPYEFITTLNPLIKRFYENTARIRLAKKGDS